MSKEPEKAKQSLAWTCRLQTTIKVWARKETDEEGDSVTALYLDPEGLTQFGHYWNRSAKRVDFARVTNKKHGLVPCEITVTMGHAEEKASV